VLQRFIAAVLGVLGLLAIGLGVASSTVWRGDSVLTATAAPQAHLLVADPGVLNLAGNPVTITVRAADAAPVVIAVGRDTDVAGWVGTDAYTRITGLAGWHTLRTQPVAAQPAPTATAPTAGSATPSPDAASAAATGVAGAPAPSATASSAPAPAAAADPTNSDLWVAQATGKGSATLTWDVPPGRWSLLVASLGSTSPTVQLAWPRAVTTPWLWPGIIIGALLLLAASALLVRLWARARKGLSEPEWHPVTTGAVPVRGVSTSGAHQGGNDVTPTAVLTRRQMREADAVGAPPGRRRVRVTSDHAQAGFGSPASVAEPVGTAAGSGASGDLPTGRPRAGGAESERPATRRRDDRIVRGQGPLETRGDTNRADRPRADPAPADPSRTMPEHTEPSYPRAFDPRPPASRASRALPTPPPDGPELPRSAQPTPLPGVPTYFSHPDAATTGRGAVTPSAPGAWLPGGPSSRHSAAQPAEPKSAAKPTVPNGPARPDPRTDAGAPTRPPSTLPSWTSGKPASSARTPAPPRRDAGDPPGAQAAAESPSGRADAWRRAWGFPGYDHGAAADELPETEPPETDEGTRR
jgi:hypothetical protein